MTVVSHHYKFIFIKTAKTAGTSIQMALEKVCGPEDICAPITKKKRPREGEESYRARNHEGRFIPKFIRGEGQGLRILPEIKELWRRKKFRSHMLATDVRWRLGNKLWDDYYKFTIERNPWDKVVSDYFWAQRHPENQIPIDQWIKEGRWSGSHFHFYTIGGQVAMNRIIRYEHLEEDLGLVFKEVGVSAPVDLPKAKTGFRSQKLHYRDVHSDYTRQRVAEEFHREIAYFGYTF
jgi:hypothetical protein